MSETLAVKRSRAFALAAMLIAVAILAGCDSKQPTPPPLPLDESAALEGERIVLAIHPYASVIDLAQQYAPLTDYLAARIGRPVSLSISKDYETHIARVAGGAVDLALMGPAAYVKLSEQCDSASLLCCFETNGGIGFHGCIVVREDNPATSLEDLAGKTFAIVSRESTMSYVVPRAMFAAAGVSFDEALVGTVGSHGNVCLNILAGDVNAGSVQERAYLKYKDRGLKTIAVTPTITDHPFVATERLDAETRERVREALLAIKADEQVKRLLTPIKASLTGFAPIEDKDYDSLRVIVAAGKEAGGEAIDVREGTK